MNRLIAKAALAAIVSLGTLTPLTTSADAHVRIGVVVGAPGYRYPARIGRCASWMALDKARLYGIRRPLITRVGPNRVVVEGRRNYRWARIVFANVRGCPVVYR